MQRLFLVALVVLVGCPSALPRAPVPVRDPAAPVLVDPVCATNGCLRALTELGSFTRADIEPFLLAGVNISTGYRVLTIEYATAARSSTATVTLPIDLIDDAPVDGFPVVVNAHGTIGIEDPCRISGTISGTGLAGLFGGRGAIGIAPDYPGLGTVGLHPYLDAQSEGESVLDAVRAALLVARHVGVIASGRSAVVGLSQGGHASLAAAALHASYAPELDIRAFAASAPASVYAEHWAPGILINGPHLSMFALLAYSWAAQSGVDDNVIWASGLAGDIDALMANRCAWSPAFGTEPLLGDAISQVPSEVFAQPFIDAFSSGAWSDDLAFMGERFERNRVVAFAQTAPVRIWQGTADTVVLPAMTQELVADLVAGGMEVELTLVDGGTHIDTAFGFLAFPELATADSVAWVKAQLQAP